MNVDVLQWCGIININIGRILKHIQIRYQLSRMF